MSSRSATARCAARASASRAPSSPASTRSTALIEQAIVVLQRLGAEIVDPVDLALPSYSDAELRVLLYELKADLPKYLASFAPSAR
jgi:hypothetical protein